MFRPNVAVLFFLSLFALVFICSPVAADSSVDYRADDPMIAFAVGQLQDAIQGRDGDWNVTIETDAAGLKPEGFEIIVTDNVYTVSGADSAGAMYGTLELAEQIRTLGRVTPCKKNPYMKRRGVKFNCPLDVRTPSYTDVCDAAQNNIAEMWNLDFWKEYIDNLAEHRYNYISLWSLHPFPSLVRVPEYPDVALDDVRRSTCDWKEYYSLNGIGFDAPEILENYETLKKISMDEKIKFWREVMAYGKSRNVDFYFVTWNIFVNGTDGKYGITDRIDNETTRDYFRQSVKQLLLTYPDLAGVGLTTGENMHGSSFQKKEDWAYDTYAQGMLDAAKESPGRKFTFIHRQHQTGALDIADKFKPLIDHPNIDFIFSFKYAKAHVYSSTVQTNHPRFVEDITERGGLKTIWTLRNDDTFYFRWGAPDFVREFVKNIPYDVSDGYYFGSDQYIWGREFMFKGKDLPETGAPRELEIVKHWYQWLLWGRMGYDPSLSNERLVAILADRFPETDARQLFEAWQAASMIYPAVTGFHWGMFDFQWYIEGCRSTPGYAKTETGFHDVNRFITLPPHPGTDNISIPNYVKAVKAGGADELEGTTPIEVAAQVLAHAKRANELANGLKVGDNVELQKTQHDLLTLSYLGFYYARKIEGSTEVALYRAGLGDQHKARAVELLSTASRMWDNYVAYAKIQYKNPLWTNRVGHCDWEKMKADVKRDIEIAREAKVGRD